MPYCTAVLSNEISYRLFNPASPETKPELLLLQALSSLQGRAMDADDFRDFRLACLFLRYFSGISR